MLVLIDFAIGNFKCLGQANDAISVFCSSTHISLLRTSMNELFNFTILADVHKTGTLWAMKFMSASSHATHMKFFHVVTIMTHGLYSIGMKERVVLTCQVTHPFNI